MPHVSIVILNWNQREDTLACLTSLQESTYGNYDVVLVDNGSTDGSQDAITAQFNDVTVLAQTSNLGCAEGRNVGARYALERQADYVLFLDNDTIVKPDFLNHLVVTGESDSTIGALGPEIRYHHERQRIWTAGARVDQRTGYTYPMRHGDTATSAEGGGIYDADFIAGCAILAKRAIFEALGFFDEDYFVYFEDTDWCVRASAAGYRIVVVPESIVWHKESQALGGASSPGKIYYMTRNQLLFVTKRFPKRRRLPMLTRILLNETRTIVLHSILRRYRGLRLQRDACVRGVIDYLRGGTV